MDNIKTFKLEELKRMFNKERHKFVGLQNDSGQFIVPFNTPAVKSTVQFAKIEEALKKESIPDGVYYYVHKDSLIKTAPIYEHMIVKGNKALLKEKPQQHVVISSATEQVWGVNEVVEKLNYINKLEMKVEQLEKQAQLDAAYIAELEGKQPELGEGNVSNMFKDISETFAPIIDKYFEQEDKRLALKTAQFSRAMNQNRQQIPIQMKRPAVVSTPGLREDGGVPTDSANYREYFERVYNLNDDATLDYELTILEKSNPQLYQTLCNEFNIDTAENEEGN